MEYIGAALLANTVYGAATGETGGVIGEAFGVQDKIDKQQADAKQAAADANAASQAAADKRAADLKASMDAQLAATQAQTASMSLPSVTPPAATVTLATPPVATAPPAMPVASVSQLQGKRDSLVQMRRRQGRASTILTGQSDTLG